MRMSALELGSLPLLAVPGLASGERTTLAFIPNATQWSGTQTDVNRLLLVGGNRRCATYDKKHHCKTKILKGSSDCVCVWKKHKKKHKEKKT